MSHADANCLPDAIRSHVRLTPDATALVWRDRTTSYGELAGRMERSRAELDTVDPQRRPVALLCEKSPAAVAAVLASFDRRTPVFMPSLQLDVDRRDELVDELGCGASIGDAGVVELRSTASSTIPSTFGPGRGCGADTALVLTTSGSTGPPKAVPLTFTAIDRFVRWASSAWGTTPATTVLNYAPLNFDVCLLDVWTTLAAGGTAVLVTAEEAVQAARLVQLVQQHSIAIVHAVPMMFSLMAGVDAELPEVRHAITTGDVLPPSTLRSLPDLFPAASIHNVYGCTETNDSFRHRVTAHDIEVGTLPIGFPLPGVEFRIRASGPSHEPDTCDGEVGELLVRTPFQTPGYLDPVRDRERFVSDDSQPDEGRFFCSGDVVRRVGSAIHLVGRADHQVKVRGIAVNTAEIERVLIGHPGISEAAVIALGDPVAGSRLVCSVTAEAGPPPSGLALRKWCATEVPRAAIPTAFEISSERLPRTATGKVDRPRLASSWGRRPVGPRPTAPAPRPPSVTDPKETS